jgi:hypothetical protein
VDACSNYGVTALAQPANPPRVGTRWQCRSRRTAAITPIWRCNTVDSNAWYKYTRSYKRIFRFIHRPNMRKGGRNVLLNSMSLHVVMKAIGNGEKVEPLSGKDGDGKNRRKAKVGSTNAEPENARERKMEDRERWWSQVPWRIDGKVSRRRRRGKVSYQVNTNRGVITEQAGSCISPCT